MTLSQVEEQWEYWRKHPPAHELIAMQAGYKPPLTVEEQWRQGAMGPEDFAAWVEHTGGRKLSV
jgi:hypothetical protein